MGLLAYEIGFSPPRHRAPAMYGFLQIVADTRELAAEGSLRGQGISVVSVVKGNSVSWPRPFPAIRLRAGRRSP